MFQFRLLLLIIGVLAFIFGSESYSPPPYPGAEPYHPPGPPPPPNYYSSYQNQYQQPNYPVAPNYGSNCAYMKVIEVLDQIFCQHAERKRYSSTIYPDIDLITKQLEYVSFACFLPSVYQNIQTAIQVLKTLQDSTYSTFGDSSLLEPYFEIFFPIKSQDSESQAKQAEGAATKTVTAQEELAEKLSDTKTQLTTHETNMQTYKTKFGMLPDKEAESKVVAGEEKEVVVKEEEVVKEAEADKKAEAAVVDEVVTPEEDAQKEQKKRRVISKSYAKAFSAARKTRGAETYDYTCSLLQPVTCYGEDKYDDLLYNMENRLFSAVGLINQALWDTWFYIFELECSGNEWDKWAIMEASSTYGSLLTSLNSLYDVAFAVDRVYTIIELDSNNSPFYRAGGGGGAQPMPMPNMRQPPPMNMNRPPPPPPRQSQGYPYGYNPSYPNPQQYRPSRGVTNLWWTSHPSFRSYHSG